MYNPRGKMSRRGMNKNRGGSRKDFRGGSFRGGFNRGGSRGRFVDKSHRPYGCKFVERLNEEDVGITQYINAFKGFKGVLKARYSDFQVNEIDKDGVVAKLTSLEVPIDPLPVQPEEDDDDLVNRYRIEQLPIETWDKLHKIVVQEGDSNEVIEIDVTNVSKDERTKIHEAVRTVFGAKIVGTTITKDDKKCIIFKKFNKHDKIDMREKWPATREGEYVYFLVHKEFIDTIEANIQLSDCLQMRPSNFCYAGVKDRRAKTTQWFCVRRVEPEVIVERTKNLKNISVGNFCYKKETLKLGHLQGNQFRIAIREIVDNQAVIEKGLNSLKNYGFINYFGLQRFGNSKEIPTHIIGIKLLTGLWEEAVNLILKPRKFEQFPDIASAKITYKETSDATAAILRLRNRNKSIEGKLLTGLMKHNKNDYVNALENVPRNMRLLYIHAYQSLVWNTMTSRRIKEFGLFPIVGDIVVENEQDVKWDLLNTDLLDSEPQKDVKEQLIKVKILTKEDIPKYTIYDIVLPLPGYDITYPGNIIKDWYKEYLENDGLSLEMPKQKVKTYTLSGAYRKIVERASNMSWKFVHYNNPTDTLIRSDFEELKGKTEPETCPDGTYKALVLQFCLSSACYATMALRELMKINTSWEGPKEQSVEGETSESKNTDNENGNVSVKTEVSDENLGTKRKNEDVTDATEDVKKIKSEL